MRRRIAFIDYFPPHYRRLLYEEVGRRMDADFIFFSDSGERWHNPELALAYEGDYRRLALPTRRIAGQPVVPGIARSLSRRRYDAVVKNPNGKLMFPFTYLTAKAHRLPFVLWTGMWHHPTTAFHRASKPLTEAIYRGSDAIVTYGEHVKRFVCETRGVDPRKVFVAGQAVDPSRFSVVEPDRSRPEILFIGQFEERKGISTLLDAFDRVEAEGARLRIVGNGPLEGLIRERASQSDGRIEILGHVPQEALPAELARSRFLVLPSVTTDLDREPWGLVVNEAMHAGLPVVASDTVGAAAGGLVRDGENGFVVAEREVEPLAVAMQALASDPELAARLGESARVAAAEFDYSRMGAAFEAAVEHAIEARR